MSVEIVDVDQIQMQVDAQNEADLVQVEWFTNQMRAAEQQISSYGKQRRHLMAGLRERKVSFRKIAARTGTTEQAVYKDLRWGKK
jgi:hypothetical protein